MDEQEPPSGVSPRERHGTPIKDSASEGGTRKARAAEGASQSVDSSTARGSAATSLYSAACEGEAMPSRAVREMDGIAFEPVHPEIGDVYGHLSTRERSVLHYLADGDAKKVIACKVGIEEATVKTHVAALIRKLHLAARR